MYTDLLIRLKNAQAVKKDVAKVPYSEMDFNILKILQKYGFIESAEKKGRLPKRTIEVKLRYDEDKIGAINGVRLISKPGRRLYIGYKNLWPVKNNYGINVLSTSKGILSNKDAKKLKVGGVNLFEIW